MHALQSRRMNDAFQTLDAMNANWWDGRKPEDEVSAACGHSESLHGMEPH